MCSIHILVKSDFFFVQRSPAIVDHPIPRNFGFARTRAENEITENSQTLKQTSKSSQKFARVRADRAENMNENSKTSKQELYFLDSPAFAYNFGHFLIDHVVSAYTGLFLDICLFIGLFSDT